MFKMTFPSYTYNIRCARNVVYLIEFLKVHKDKSDHEETPDILHENATSTFPIFYVSIVLFTGLIPALSWSRSEPENPPAWHPRIPWGRLWNTPGLAASKISIRYTIRNAESLSNKHYDMTYFTCKFCFVLCFIHSSCILR